MHGSYGAVGGEVSSDLRKRRIIRHEQKTRKNRNLSLVLRKASVVGDGHGNLKKKKIGDAKAIQDTLDLANLQVSSRPS